MLVNLDNFLNKLDLEYIKDFINTSPSANGNQTAGSNMKSNKKIYIYRSTQEMHDLIFSSINKDRLYTKVAMGDFKILSQRFSVYKENDYYDWHFDIPKFKGNDNSIAYTIWLNDPEEYDGGELLIKHSFGQTSLKEKAGTAVFYPASHMHKVNKIIKGCRKVCIGWINCDIKNSKIRENLYHIEDSLSILNDFCKRKVENEAEVEEIYNVILKLLHVHHYLKKSS